MGSFSIKHGMKAGSEGEGQADGAGAPPQQVTAAKRTDANTVDVEAKTKG